MRLLNEFDGMRAFDVLCGKENFGIEEFITKA